jgi:hypothetical protein
MSTVTLRARILVQPARMKLARGTNLAAFDEFDEKSLAGMYEMLLDPIDCATTRQTRQMTSTCSAKLKPTHTRPSYGRHGLRCHRRLISQEFVS